MRMGRVSIIVSYPVDLDNESMVNHAKECVYEDIMSAVKYDELFNWIKVDEDPTAKPVDIPDFLQEDMSV